MEADQDIFLVTQREIGGERAGGKGPVHRGHGLPHHADPAACPVQLCPGDGGGAAAGPPAAACGRRSPSSRPMWRPSRRSSPLRPCGRAPGRRPCCARPTHLFGEYAEHGQRCAGGGRDHGDGQPGPRLSWRTISPRTSPCATPTSRRSWRNSPPSPGCGSSTASWCGRTTCWALSTRWRARSGTSWSAPSGTRSSGTQIRVLQNELGETDDGDEDEIDPTARRSWRLELPEETEKHLLKEVNKLAKQPFGSAEGAVIRNYLDVCLEMPWNTTTKERVSVDGRPQGAGKGPLRPGKGEGADSGDHRRPADESGRQGADPLPGGPARRGQDLHRHLRGQGAEPEAGPPVPGRRPGRGGHPGPPEDLHRRHARPDHRGHQPQRVHESRCCCWTRSTSWAATTGATRPPRCWRCWTASRTAPSGTTSWRSRWTCPRSCSSPPPTPPTPSPGPCWTGWRSSSCSSYTDEEKLQIAKRHLLPKQLAGARTEQERSCSISDDAHAGHHRGTIPGSPACALLERRARPPSAARRICALLEGHCQAGMTRDRGGAPRSLLGCQRAIRPIIQHGAGARSAW